MTHRKVTFTNRYGIALAGDLYQPKGASGKQAALGVCGPFGAVKEQSSGLYAQTMAVRGFVTLAFDPSYTGESGGEPRSVASPDINTEDVSAAVDTCLPTTGSKVARRGSWSSRPTTTGRRAATTRVRSTPVTPGRSPRRCPS